MLQYIKKELDMPTCQVLSNTCSVRCWKSDDYRYLDYVISFDELKNLNNYTDEEEYDEKVLPTSIPYSIG